MIFAGAWCRFLTGADLVDRSPILKSKLTFLTTSGNGPFRVANNRVMECTFPSHHTMQIKELEINQRLSILSRRCLVDAYLYCQSSRNMAGIRATTPFWGHCTVYMGLKSVTAWYFDMSLAKSKTRREAIPSECHPLRPPHARQHLRRT